METILEKNQVTIEDEMRRSYLDYAMSVIIGRALPDVRDGLKPVHRRVLWAMHELGNTSNKPYKKSARVVGDTIGKYHPHGDTAAYDTIVRLAQDFSMRYTLVDGQGNFGSVDGDAAAAMRYCLTGQSLTITNKGLGRIDKIANSEDIQIEILSHEQQTNIASKWFDCGEFPVFKVKTRHGYEITGTSNHPLLCWKADANGRPHFVWKTIAELQEGDFLVLDRSESLWAKDQISLIEFVPQIEVESRTESHELPQILNEDLAFLLGALTAEGTVQDSRIEFGNVEGEFADKFVEVWERTFRACRLHRWLREPNSYGKKSWWQIQIVSKQVVKFFHNLGLHGKSSEREVPELILASPQKVVAAFLRGLYEGAGSVERSGRSLLRITLTSNSETMLKQLQVLLLRFGIITNRFCDVSHGRSTHRLCITGAENLGKFAAKIGFCSTVKTDSLNAVLALSSGKVLAKNDFVPHLAEFVRTRDLGNQRNWFLKHNFDRLPRLQKALPRLKTALVADDFAFVENLANANNLFDQIVNIESAGEQRVYSIRVDSDCHSFVSNGFINHNTEIRLQKLSNEILADIEKETVNFQPNYDESLSEPVVMPVRFPNLLVNGSEGIAVGMATKIPPHNLTEILEATIALVKNPDISVDNLIKIVPGPDFPTGGFIYGRDEIHRAYREGRGVIQLRARAAIDRIGRGEREKDAIVVTEIPYQVNKARLIERIAELVNEKKLDGISEMRDESNREGMRIVIELKRDAIPQVVLNKLYKLTPMQTSFGIITLGILNGQPRVLNLKQVLEAFVDFRREVIRRRTEFELRKARARAHVLEGLDKAIDALDYIVPLVRNSRSLEDAKAWLTGNVETLREQKSWKGAPADKTLAGFLKELEATMNRLQFSEIQAQAILDLQLRRLSALERQKIADELANLRTVIADLEAILANETVLRSVIIKELETVKRDFGDKRKTEIVDAGIEIRIEDLIADEEVAITVTNAGYIKRTAVSTYSKQNRGGKGRFGATAKNEDFVEHLFTASTHDSLMIFTDDGQVFKMKVHEIPDGAAASRGKAIVNVINIPSTRKAVGVIPVRDFTEEKFVLMVTKNGVVKKTALSDFQHIRANGINAANVDEEDELLDVILTDGNHQIFIATNNGLAIRFNETDVRAMGRAARGVRGINLRKNDFVIGVVCVSPEGDEKLLSISEQGYGKQTKVKDYRLQTRGGYGVINMKANEKTGKVVAVFPVSEDAEVMIITQQAKLIRLGANEIRSTGRSASGVRLIRTGDDDIVTSASLLDSVTDEENGEGTEQ